MSCGAIVFTSEFPGADKQYLNSHSQSMFVTKSNTILLQNVTLFVDDLFYTNK